MIKFILIPVMAMLSCGSTKNNQNGAEKDSIAIGSNSNNMDKDSLNKQLAGKTNAVELQMPICIKNKIDSFKLKEAHEQPQKVMAYNYKGKTVYYVVMPCCDFFNEVYDENCNYLGAPDGGFTGKGDGHIPDFFAERKEEKTIWKAESK